MNAKIAAAISLGASSLVLIGSIGIANASQDATTTLTQDNTVVSTTATASVGEQTSEGFDRVSEPVAVDPKNNADSAGGKTKVAPPEDIKDAWAKAQESLDTAKDKYDSVKTHIDEAERVAQEVTNALNGAADRKTQAERSIETTKSKIKELENAANKQIAQENLQTSKDDLARTLKEVEQVKAKIEEEYKKVEETKRKIEDAKAQIEAAFDVISPMNRNVLNSVDNLEKKYPASEYPDYFGRTGKYTAGFKSVTDGLNDYMQKLSDARTKLDEMSRLLTEASMKAQEALNPAPAAPAPAPQQQEQDRANEQPQDPQVAPQAEAPAAKKSGSNSRTNSHYAAAGKAYEKGILDAQALEKLGTQAAGESAPAVVPAANKASAGAQKAQANQAAASATAGNAGNASASSASATSSASSASSAAGAAKSAGSSNSAKSNNAKDSASSANSADSSDSASSESKTDSADSKSNKNEESNNEDSKSGDKSAQASAANNGAQTAGNNTTLIAAVTGSIIAGIGAIGAGWHFMRIRRK